MKPSDIEVHVSVRMSLAEALALEERLARAAEQAPEPETIRGLRQALSYELQAAHEALVITSKAG